MIKSKRKVKLSFIEDETARRTTFKKRQKGLLKKVYELSTLCDVQTCAIIYSPYDVVDAEMWPSKDGVNDVVSMFKRLSEMDQNKRKMNLVDFVWQRFKKGEERMKKLVDENREMVMREFMFDCMKGNMFKYRYGLKDLLSLGSYIDKVIEDCNRMMNNNGGSSSSSSNSSSSSSSAPVLIGFHDQIGRNQTEQNQYPTQMVTESVPLGFYDQFQVQNMNLAPMAATNVEFPAQGRFFHEDGIDNLGADTVYALGFHDQFQYQNMNLAPNLAPMATSNAEFSAARFQNQNLVIGGGVASNVAPMAATNAEICFLGFDNQFNQTQNQNGYVQYPMNQYQNQQENVHYPVNLNSCDHVKFGNHDMNLGQIYNENQQQWSSEFMEDPNPRQIDNGGELLGFHFMDNNNF